MQDLDQHRAKRILKIQGVLLLVVTAGFFVAKSETALSAFIGGGIVTLANAVFAYLVFGRYQAQEPGKLVTRFYGAELLKLLLVVLGFAATFLWLRPLNPVALFGAFFVVQILPPILAHMSENRG